MLDTTELMATRDTPDNHDLPPPSAWLLAMEFRAPWEFGGLLPATSFAIVASTGDIYAGLWYPIIFASITAGCSYVGYRIRLVGERIGQRTR